MVVMIVVVVLKLYYINMEMINELVKVAMELIERLKLFMVSEMVMLMVMMVIMEILCRMVMMLVVD